MAMLNNQRVYLAVSQRQLDAKGGVAEAFQAEAWESEGTSLRLISWQSYRNSSVPERHLGWSWKFAEWNMIQANPHPLPSVEHRYFVWKLWDRPRYSHPIPPLVPLELFRWPTRDEPSLPGIWSLGRSVGYWRACIGKLPGCLFQSQSKILVNFNLWSFCWLIKAPGLAGGLSERRGSSPKSHDLSACSYLCGLPPVSNTQLSYQVGSCRFYTMVWPLLSMIFHIYMYKKRM